MRALTARFFLPTSTARSSTAMASDTEANPQPSLNGSEFDAQPSPDENEDDALRSPMDSEDAEESVKDFKGSKNGGREGDESGSEDARFSQGAEAEADAQEEEDWHTEGEASAPEPPNDIPTKKQKKRESVAQDSPRDFPAKGKSKGEVVAEEPFMDFAAKGKGKGEPIAQEPPREPQAKSAAVAQEPISNPGAKGKAKSGGEKRQSKAASEQAQKKRKITEGTLPPDLKVIMEDEIFEVHSLILMMVSTVFEKKLRDGTKELILDGDKEEFVEFWKILQPMSHVEINEKNVLFLSRWANEYKVEPLKTRCENYCMQNLQINVPHWIHAHDNDLQRWAKQCEEKITANVLEYIDGLNTNVLQTADDMLKALWPQLIKAADVSPPYDMPDPSGAVRPMFPFVTAAVKKAAAAAKKISTND